MNKVIAMITEIIAIPLTIVVIPFVALTIAFQNVYAAVIVYILEPEKYKQYLAKKREA